MDDTTLYEAVLGLESPWQVDEVRLDTTEETVEVEVSTSDRRLPCPICGRLSPRYDARPRRWRHLDTCQFQTILCAQVPRVNCVDDGIKQVRVPWADRKSKFTALFEARVIRWLQEASLSAVAQLFDLSWTAVDGIQKRAVLRGIKRRTLESGRHLPERLGIDETSFQKRHEYVTVVCDQQEGTVVYVADSRKAEVVEEYLKSFDAAQRAGVQTVAMDMWQGYISAVERWIPDAETKICFDKFHIAQHLGKAVDQVRREEHRALQSQEISVLKGTRYTWLWNGANLSPERLSQLAQLKKIAVKTGRAWAIKETGMDAWRYRSERWARAALRKWYSWAIRSRLAPIKKVARMIQQHLDGIVNAIVHDITNARSEGINSRIQWIKYTARGFRNRERFRNAIYFHLGGLDMTPEVLKPIRLHTS